MKKISLFVCLLNVNAQECGFETPENYQTFDEFNQQRVSATTENYCINVCFRIVRDDNGTNAAIVPTIIPQVLAQLNAAYNPHRIYFNQVGTFDYINNSSYNSYLSGNSPANIPNCLNIYFIKNFSTLGELYGGIASFGTLRATIKGSHALLNYTVPHEVGHALNLLHTFNCTNGFNNIQGCTENPLNSSGCTSKGDRICDTPADYNPLTYNTTNWPSYAIGFYNPDKQNIMSYWSTKNKFTNGQGDRMKNAILGAPQLQGIRANDCSRIVGRSSLCRRFLGNRINFYQVVGSLFATPTTYNWSVSGNLQIVGSSTNPIVRISRLNNNTTSTPSIITVTINGNITKTKSIITNCFSSRAAGLYDWVSTGYGNMGLVVPIDPQDEEDPIIKYNWEIIENPNSNPMENGSIKPYFVGSNSNESNIFSSTDNQAVVNWGTCVNSYLIKCHGISLSGNEYLLEESYVDVGDPKNNPCYKNAVQSVIAPNPVRNGQLNVVVIKPEYDTPCNYKNLEEQQAFNSELDRINNSITIFDLNGNEIYRNVFETNEFTIDGLNLISGNNYVVNLFTNEGGFRQQVIIAE
jgi:hypothetical protein